MLANGSGFSAPHLWSSMAFNGTKAMLAGDVNGDGKTDLIAVNTGSSWVMLSNGSGFRAPHQWSNIVFNGTGTMLAGDLNGDGKTDLIAVNYNSFTNTGSSRVMLANGSSFERAAAVVEHGFQWYEGDVGW